ncbi:hypothetical protein PHYBLDRAFT_168873 [Phycomyces blakesleeanus NRRL 1555(-)]|uniref:Uncharacterized protein n=1 Tax=Phycomyces blakesleeanus (strain ATCC 8743b / DSM 1359 / FGSC 10004 / NBRC 33097 / NRRL 1555) TaxID=763407 RepID=A0A167MQ95_PHYB8|nr:hypothetical protein PHYBLDRAFT_168873 [Phycomyces blakesleeanus NRRL 1555(-)]OAD73524.1 hypothetical protein PHYBLDRAFT_168873 [Phycomyces blakesleeanus NRRL 1555(-)]|eukprot:XP_018291564.1 hypothetical protein PHYBLDRAFT_168873 [Phycomyces blakesleeanus NRRL 1555(-)]
MNVVMKTDDHRTVTTAGTLPQSGAIRHGSWTGRHCCEARPTLHFQSVDWRILLRVDDLNYSSTEISRLKMSVDLGFLYCEIYHIQDLNGVATKRKELDQVWKRAIEFERKIQNACAKTSAKEEVREGYIKRYGFGKKSVSICKERPSRRSGKMKRRIGWVSDQKEKKSETEVKDNEAEEHLAEIFDSKSSIRSF